MRQGLGHAGEDISHSPDGTNQSAPTLELFAQMTYVHIEKTIVGRSFAFEQGGGDFVARDDAAGGADEHIEQVELHGGEFYRSAGTPDLTGVRVDANVANGNGSGLRADGGLGAAQDGSNAGQQLIGIEGLGEVVVGSCIEAMNAILLLDARCEHDDGKIFAPAQLLKHGKAIENGQHDIENGKVVCDVQCAGQAFAAVVGTLQTVPGFREELLHHAAQFCVVIDEQQGKLLLLFDRFHFHVSAALSLSRSGPKSRINRCSRGRLNNSDRKSV